MPPRALRRNVRMQELFVHIHSNYNEEYRFVCSMTIFMLSLHGYIRVPNVAGITIYPASFFYICSFAFFNYHNHTLRLVINVQFEEEGFGATLQRQFIRMYLESSADGRRDLAILKTCAFAMNMCRYIQEHGISRRYTMCTVTLLAQFILGENQNFAGFEEEMGNEWSNIDMPMRLVELVGDQNREPQETYNDISDFMLSLTISTPRSP